MPIVFFLNTLHHHVTPEAYEEWVRTVDYPTARSLPSILEYTVTRAEGLLEGKGIAPYQYVERVVVTDLVDYRRDLASPSLSEFSEAWNSYVATSIAIRGTLIE